MSRMPKRKRHSSGNSVDKLLSSSSSTEKNNSDCDNDADKLSSAEDENANCNNNNNTTINVSEDKESPETNTNNNNNNGDLEIENKSISESSVNNKPETSTVNSSIRRKSNRISLKKSISFKKSNSTNDETTASAANGNDPESTTNNNLDEFGNISDVPCSSSTSSTTTATAAQSIANNKNVNASSSTSSTTGKSLRKIQVWTEDDTKWFFEALCEHGKDFPHIQTYIAARSEKKGIPQDMIKNYEQVRHFYYRMWHKISHMLKISSVIEKGVQEIYGLINYGEIWKRFGTKFDSKISINLQQLVDYGYTTFKVKGKSVRVRTPVCNALKRIHNINNKTISKPISHPLPKEITVELIPATNADWIRIHSLAQNPRLRTKLTMQHRLSTLIAYLEKRWSIVLAKENICRSLLGIDLSEEKLNSPNQLGTSSAENGCTNENVTKKNYSLLLRPLNSEKLNDQVMLKSTSNSISCNNYRSTTHANAQIDFSLSGYLKNLYTENNNLNSENKKSKRFRSSNKKSLVQTDSPKNSEDKANSGSGEKDNSAVGNQEKISIESDKPEDLLKLLDSMNEELEVSEKKTNVNRVDLFEREETAENVVEDDTNNKNNNKNEILTVVKLPEPPANTTLAQWLAEESSNKINETEEFAKNNDQTGKNEADSLESKANNNKKRRGSAEISNSEVVNLLTAEQARQGWTLETSSVTIGELYLLFSCPDKIVLEYTWTSTTAKNVAKADNTSDECQNSEITSSEQSSVVDSPSVNNDNPVNVGLSTLQKFLIAANLSLISYKKHNSIITTTNSSQPASSTNLSAHSKRTKKSAKTVCNSQMLSNLIQNTIFSDLDVPVANNEQDSSGKKPTNSENNIKATRQNLNNKNSSAASGGENVNQNQVQTTTKKQQFVAPKMPVSRSYQQSNLKSKYRTATILNDPSEIQEVLNELKTNKSRRQRRPMPKPFLFNFSNHKVHNSNLSKFEAHSSVLSPSPLPQCQSISKQSVLAEPITSLVGDNSSVVTSNNHLSHFAHPPKESPINNTTLTSLEATPVSTTNSLNTPISIDSLSSSVSITSSTIVAKDGKTIENCNHQEKLRNDTLHEKNSHDIVDGTISQSQLSWLNSDISIGSLIAACDIPAPDGGGLSTNTAVTNHKNVSESLGSEIETHMNSLANDNSIDLMAKFADLAAQINFDSKHI